MKLTTLAIAFSVASCTSVENYEPYTPALALHDPVQLHADQVQCRLIAEGYKPDFDLLGVGVAAGQGALGNLTAAAAAGPTAPVVLATGAAGQAGQAALPMAGIVNNTQTSVYYDCLKRRGDRSGAYEVYDPTQK